VDLLIPLNALAIAVVIVYFVVDRIPMTQPARTIVYVVLAVIVILILLQIVGVIRLF
jgi:predicted membrane channel-forming protein YqfA (hemolysin III family)